MKQRRWVLTALLLCSIPFRTDAQDVVFSPPVNVSNTPALSGPEALAIDASGTIYVLWEESRSSILFSRSSDGGETFIPPQTVIPPDRDSSPGQVAVASGSPGMVHTSVTQFDTVFGGAAISYLRSIDGGDTFSSPQLMSTRDGINYIKSSIATDGNGAVGIAWAGANLRTGQNNISYSRSIDNGDTFSAPMILTDADTLPVYCPDIKTFGAQNVYIVWNQKLSVVGDDSDTFFTRSVDGGLSFTTPINISNLPGRGWCPKTAVDESGNIYVVWEKGQAFLSRKTLFVKSTDGGLSFNAPPLSISDPTGDSACSSFAAAGTGKVYITFTYSTNHESALVFSGDGGGRFTPPFSIPRAICPEIATRNQNEIGLTWSEPPSPGDYTDVFYMRGVVSLTSSVGRGK